MDNMKYTLNRSNLYEVSEITADVKAIFIEKQKQENNFDISSFSIKTPVKIDTVEMMNKIRSCLGSIVGGENLVRLIDYTTTMSEFSVDSAPNVNVAKLFVKKSSSKTTSRYYTDEDIPDSIDEDDKVDSHNAVILTIEICGQKQFAVDILRALKNLFTQINDENKTSMVKWIYPNHGSTYSHIFKITKDWEVHKEFYPYIKAPDLNSYYQKFLDNDSQVMVLHGPPGTGKTSFIKDMICELGLNAIISYDMGVLSSDANFVGYLEDNMFDVLIIEDADDLLTSDRSENNKLIAKILNISDGIIKLRKKKLIFSTNLDNINKIDSAVVRPGRCFDIVNFRKLTGPESEAVGKVLGIEVDNREAHTLAELFYAKNNNEKSQHSSIGLKKAIGF